MLYIRIINEILIRISVIISAFFLPLDILKSNVLEKL